MLMFGLYFICTILVNSARINQMPLYDMSCFTCDLRSLHELLGLYLKSSYLIISLQMSHRASVCSQSEASTVPTTSTPTSSMSVNRRNFLLLQFWFAVHVHQCDQSYWTSNVMHYAQCSFTHLVVCV